MNNKEKIGYDDDEGIVKNGKIGYDDDEIL